MMMMMRDGRVGVLLLFRGLGIDRHHAHHLVKPSHFHRAIASNVHQGTVRRKGEGVKSINHEDLVVTSNEPGYVMSQGSFSATSHLELYHRRRDAVTSAAGDVAINDFHFQQASMVFSGSLLPHMHDVDKSVLVPLDAPAGSQHYYEIKNKDVGRIETLPTIVDPRGRSMSNVRVFVKRGAVITKCSRLVVH